jgi:serine/threonine protein kinase
MPKQSRPGRFQIIERIGSGGQGTVYKARDRMLERTVAIKHISADAVGRSDGAKAIPDEARMAARLQHPNIIPIFDLGTKQGRPLLVFEYVQGRTFREIIDAEGAMAPRRALALFRPVLQGMAHAHERRVLHLDLSPGNVLVSDRDVPRIMDFGLSQMLNATPETTTALVGTVLYMAPEQIEEQPPGPYTDVRALGLILYELLTAVPAIKATNSLMAARIVCTRDIDLEPLDTGPEAAPLVRFLAGAVARDPKQRYPNATAMLNAFDEAMRAREQAERAAEGNTSSATVEFLLRRMQRRGDFPALSRSLVEVNRMTSSDSKATAQQLSEVVLRDYALTNKLLKLANSAYYGLRAGEVKSVSHAITLIGFEQLRITANCLTLMSHIKDRSQSTALRNLLVRSLFTALLARHLAQGLDLRNVEEAFICGMFQTLGETLVRFYFAAEHSDIQDMMREDGCDELTATRTVLGVDYPTLGAAVSAEWRFPGDIVAAIAGLQDDVPVPAPESSAERLRDVAVFSDRSSRLLARPNPPATYGDMAVLCERFTASIGLDAPALIEAVEAALQKLGQFASVLGLSVSRSDWGKSTRSCLSSLQSAVDEDPGEPPERDPAGT